MRNITVSVDEQTYRLARIRAAELDTSVSALVRDYLRSLAAGSEGEARPGSDETIYQRRCRLLREAIENIDATSTGFRAADNLPREELYDRARARTDVQAVPGDDEDPQRDQAVSR